MSSNKDRGWEYISSDNDDGFDYDPDSDGSWGYQNDDGSGSYSGADGSWGYRNSDGSASYNGADGSWGYRNSDGSASYNGADGSWGYRNADGSGVYYGADGEAEYFDSSSDGTDDSTSAGAEALGALLGLGLFAYMSHKATKEQKRKEEEQRQEEERLRREAEERIRKRAARIKRSKRIAFYKRHWLAILIVLCLLVGSGFGYKKYVEYQKSIQIGYSSVELIGSDHSSVLSLLEESGFTNIHESPIYDLKIVDQSKEGIVTEVSVEGDNSFTSTSRYPYDARITITYHLVKDITVPLSSKAAKKLDYQELERQFRDAGFINIKTDADYDLLTGWITKEGSVESVSVDGKTSFSEYDSFRPDVEVIITYHALSKNKGT